MFNTIVLEGKARLLTHLRTKRLIFYFDIAHFYLVNSEACLTPCHAYFMGASMKLNLPLAFLNPIQAARRML